MKSKILFVISLLFGLMFINSGLNKFFNYMPMPDPMPEDIMALFNAIMSLGWLLPLIGAAEVIGGILVIIPKTRALGAIIIFPVMVGVLLTHIVNVPATLPVALVLIAINLWIIFENREKYLPMVN
jgi:putative oxidoreductase